MTITIERVDSIATATDKETGLSAYANSEEDAIEELIMLLQHWQDEYNMYPDSALTDEVIRIRDILNKRDKLMNDYSITQ